MDAYGKPSNDVTAYIARRSRCTELCNGCNMAPLLVDAMMGHAPPRGDTADWDGYLRQLDNWPVVAEMTERIVYDPDCTTHPMFAQTQLAPAVSGRSDQTSIGYTFRAAEPCTVEIVAQTLEIGDSITVTTDGELQSKDCAAVAFGRHSSPCPDHANTTSVCCGSRNRGMPHPSGCRSRRGEDCSRSLIIKEAKNMLTGKDVPITDTSRFLGDVDIGNMQKITGYYNTHGLYLAHYSVSRQKDTAAYCLRGTVSLRDPKNAVLKMKDDAGKEIYASLPIVLKSMDPEEVKREIAEKAQTLCARFADANKADSASIPIVQMTFGQVVNTYGAEYAQVRSPSSDSRQKERLSTLRKVADGLSAMPFKMIEQRQVAELCERIGTAWYSKVREADCLVRYVAERRKYKQIPNPFAAYRKTRAAPRNTRQLQKSAVSTDVLSQAEQDAAVALVLDHLAEPDYAGIGLLLGTGLKAKQVVALKYGDLQEDPDNKGSLILPYFRPELAGSMHDFSFVLSTLAQRICHERRAMLEKEGLTPGEIANRYITTNSEKPYSAGKLTAECHNILHNCGVGFGQLAGLTSNTEGAGVRLLRNTYGLRLAEDGGLREDPALLQFAQHRRPDGTQGLFYRSFTDPYSHRCQEIAHRRIQWFPPKMNSTLTAKDRSRQTKTTVHLKDGEKTVAATVRIKLQAGETVQISSDYGIRAKWSAVDDNAPETDSEA